MNLAIDIGNSLSKLAIIDRGEVVDFLKTETLDIPYLEELLEHYPAIEAAILASSRPSDEAVESWLRGRMKRFIRFDSGVEVPLRNAYRTPQTLGPDRLAAAVGAHGLYPDSPVLVVDFGTAITIDLVSAEGEFLGGNISPGARTRFRALHHFTGKLPLRELTERTALLGGDSFEAIEGGVINGIVYEIEGYIRELEPRYEGLRIIFTGGDGNFFAKRLKNPIFATYDLVAYGLNRILEYHAQK